MSPPALQPDHHMLGGTLRVFLAEVLLLPTGLLTAAFLTRRLEPEGYGLFILTVTCVSWIEGTLTSFFARATVKFVGEAQDWRPVGTTVLRLSLTLSCGVVGLLWLLASPLALLLREPALASYVWLFALDIPLFSVAQVQRNILIGIGSFGPRALASAGRWIARLILIVLLVELGLSIWGALLGSIGASFVELLVSRYYVRPSPFGLSEFPARRLWPYAAPLFLATVSLTVCSKLDLILLKVLGGTTAEAGLYGAAQNFSLLPDIFALSFAPLLLSTLSRLLSAGNTQEAREMGGTAMRLVVRLLPVASLIAGAAAEVVRVVFGPLFLPAGPLAAVLVFGALALAMISVAAAILTAAGKPEWTLRLTLPLVPLAFLGHLVLIPWLGALGAALVTTLVAGIGALASVLAVYGLWHILPPRGTMWNSLLVSAGAYALAVVWSTQGVWLFFKLPVLGLLIGLAFLLLGEFSQEEIALVRSFVGWQTQTDPNRDTSHEP